MLLPRIHHNHPLQLDTGTEPPAPSKSRSSKSSRAYIAAKSQRRPLTLPHKISLLAPGALALLSTGLPAVHPPPLLHGRRRTTLEGGRGRETQLHYCRASLPPSLSLAPSLSLSLALPLSPLSLSCPHARAHTHTLPCRIFSSASRWPSPPWPTSTPTPTSEPAFVVSLQCLCPCQLPVWL